jgi:hypothetical protein
VLAPQLARLSACAALLVLGHHPAEPVALVAHDERLRRGARAPGVGAARHRAIGVVGQGLGHPAHRHAGHEPARAVAAQHHVARAGRRRRGAAHAHPRHTRGEPVELAHRVHASPGEQPRAQRLAHRRALAVVVLAHDADHVAPERHRLAHRPRVVPHEAQRHRVDLAARRREQPPSLGGRLTELTKRLEHEAQLVVGRRGHGRDAREAPLLVVARHELALVGPRHPHQAVVALVLIVLDRVDLARDRRPRARRHPPQHVTLEAVLVPGRRAYDGEIASGVVDLLDGEAAARVAHRSVRRVVGERGHGALGPVHLAHPPERVVDEARLTGARHHPVQAPHVDPALVVLELGGVQREPSAARDQRRGIVARGAQVLVELGLGAAPSRRGQHAARRHAHPI